MTCDASAVDHGQHVHIDEVYLRTYAPIRAGEEGARLALLSTATRG